MEGKWQAIYNIKGNTEIKFTSSNSGNENDRKRGAVVTLGPNALLILENSANAPFQLSLSSLEDNSAVIVTQFTNK